MIDPIEFLPNFDSEAVSEEQSAGKPLASEMNRDVKPFSLSPSEASLLNEGIHAGMPNPMSMMQDGNAELVDFEVDQEELQEQINNLKLRLGNFRLQMQNSEAMEQMEDERIQAVHKVIGLIDKDLSLIAEQTHQFTKKETQEDSSLAMKVLDWVSGGEEILNRALLYFSDRQGRPETTVDFLKVQYAVQRATQRAELFASIVGTTVSSIKTIMTTQLG